MPQSENDLAGTVSDSATMTSEVPAPASALQPIESEPRPRPEWVRLFFHILSISLAGYLCQWIEDPLWRAGLLAGFLALFSLYEIARTRWSGWFADQLNRVVVRPQERRTRAASMDFMLGLALSFLLYRDRDLVTAVYVTAWCDPLARLVGVTFGRHRWPRSRKTVEGSLGCLVTAMIVASVCQPHLSLPILFGVGLAALTVELVPQWTWRTRWGEILSPADNFFITVAVGAALTAFGATAVSL